MRPTSQISVARHPGIPSPALDEVWLSGSGGGIHNEDFVVNVTAVELFDGDTSRGKGWVFNQQAGYIFIPAPEIFRPMKTTLAGLEVDAYRVEIRGTQFNELVAALQDRIFSIPAVDVVGLGHADQKGLFSKATYLFLNCQDQQGNQRDYTFKVAYGWYGPSSFPMLLDGRWENECGALVVQVIDEVLGGDAWWERARETLRKEGLPFGPVENMVNFGSIIDASDYMPRVLDGPEETFERVEELLTDDLTRAGFEQAAAIATMYSRRHGASASTGKPGAWGRRALHDATDDPKLCAMLLERWQPSHDAFKAAFASLPPNQLYGHGMEWIEAAAAKYGA